MFVELWSGGAGGSDVMGDGRPLPPAFPWRLKGLAPRSEAQAHSSELLHAARLLSGSAMSGLLQASGTGLVCRAVPPSTCASGRVPSGQEPRLAMSDDHHGWSSCCSLMCGCADDSQFGRSDAHETHAGSARLRRMETPAWPDALFGTPPMLLGPDDARCAAGRVDSTQNWR